MRLDRVCAPGRGQVSAPFVCFVCSSRRRFVASRLHFSGLLGCSHTASNYVLSQSCTPGPRNGGGKCLQRTSSPRQWLRTIQRSDFGAATGQIPLTGNRGSEMMFVLYFQLPPRREVFDVLCLISNLTMCYR